MTELSAAVVRFVAYKMFVMRVKACAFGVLVGFLIGRL